MSKNSQNQKRDTLLYYLIACGVITFISLILSFWYTTDLNNIAKDKTTIDLTKTDNNKLKDQYSELRKEIGKQFPNVNVDFVTTENSNQNSFDGLYDVLLSPKDKTKTSASFYTLVLRQEDRWDIDVSEGTLGNYEKTALVDYSRLPTPIQKVYNDFNTRYPGYAIYQSDYGDKYGYPVKETDKPVYFMIRGKKVDSIKEPVGKVTTDYYAGELYFDYKIDGSGNLIFEKTLNHWQDESKIKDDEVKALEQAKNFMPPKDKQCSPVATWAYTIGSLSVKYTFPTDCLPDGWAAF